MARVQTVPLAPQANHAVGEPALARATDGRPYLIRRLRSDDRAKYEAGVAALSERSRFLRFATPSPRLSKRLLDQMMDLDEERQVAYAALTPDEATLLGVARYVRLDDEPRTAEVAIGVADDWQHAGLGSALLVRAVAHARRAGLAALTAVVLAENRGARALAGDLGFSALGGAGQQVNYALPLDARRRTCPCSPRR